MVDEATLATRHSAEDVAASLYRLMGEGMRLLMGSGPPADFAGLGFAEQMRWLGVAKRGPAALERAEGRPMREAGRELFLCCDDDGDRGRAVWEAMHWPLKLLWEALARHLLVVIDCDEASGLEESEALMLDWLKRKAVAA